MECVHQGGLAREARDGSDCKAWTCGSRSPKPGRGVVAGGRGHALGSDGKLERGWHPVGRVLADSMPFYRTERAVEEARCYCFVEARDDDGEGESGAVEVQFFGHCPPIIVAARPGRTSKSLTIMRGVY